MDLRTKLVFALGSVSLASMILLGLFTYGPARDVWRQSAIQALDALAESKQSEIHVVEELWRDRVRLIRSRTRLRALVVEFDTTHAENLRPQMKRILDDARGSLPGLQIREITLYDSHGDVAATTRSGGVGAAPSLDPTEVPPLDQVELLGLSREGIDALEVRLSGAMRLSDRPVGTLIVRMGADELVEIAIDYHGLGRTGETLLGMLDGTGGIHMLHTPRHGDASNLRLRLDDPQDPMARALNRVDSTFYEDSFDYRGERVWAATRYLPELDVGLVVKFDAEEREQPLRELQSTTMRFAAALSALAVLVAILLGIRFAAPILQLTDVVEEIDRGNYRVRAPVRTEDEIGRLAFLFNRMTDRLLDSNRKLRQQIAEQEEARPSSPDAD